jgi:protein O-mannosyl-transferase
MQAKLSSGSDQLTKRTVWIWLVAILAMTFFAYAITLGFGYAYDDVLQIRDNPRIRSVEFLPGYFTHQVWAQAQNQPENLYRPFFLTWLLANFEAFGLTPWGWHLTTVLLHLMVSYLVFLLARRLIGDDGTGALVAAAVFALHPSHVEAVAWISGVSEPLAAIYFLGAFLCFVKYRENDENTLWIAASGALYTAAMLAKESAIVLPAVIACYELCFPGSETRSMPSGKESAKRVGATVVPYAVLAGIYLVIRTVVLHGFAHQISDVPRWTSILTWPWAIYFYLSQSIAPAGLGPFYDVEFANRSILLTLVVPLLALGIIALGLWWWSRRAEYRLPLFCGAWFLLTLAPALAVFTIMSRYENIHDRYLYLPSVGFALLIGFAWTSLVRRLGTRAPLWEMVVAIALLAGLAVASHHQALYWENDELLFTRGCAVAPRNVLAKLNLASELVRQHRFEGAFATAQQAVDLEPNSPLALSAAAQAAYYLGNYRTAESDYKRALTLGAPRVDQFYYLGLAQIAMRRYQEGLEVLREGLVRWPNSPGYHAGIGRGLAGMGNWSGARDEYKLELLSYPGSPGAAEALANAEAHLRSDPTGSSAAKP